MSEADEFRSRYGPRAAVLGAGQGIGRAFARRIAARGLDLLLVDVDRAALSEVAAETQAAGVEVACEVIDLGGSDAASRLATAAREHEIGLAVYTAVRSLVGPFLDEEPSRHRAAVDVNCTGALLACHAFGAAMRERGRGSLVLLSSLAGLQGTGHVAAYSAAKAFDVALAEALWWELGEHGVHVLGLLAGSTDTPGFRGHEPRVDAAALASPETVAEEALEHLADGPTWIAGEANRKIAEALGRMPRSARIEMISRSTRALYDE